MTARPPSTKRQDIVDVYHGVEVVDPYRWLETPSVERDEWFSAQNSYARRVLDAIPGRDQLRDQLREANRDSDQIEVLAVIGAKPRLFALRRSANDETSRLVVREGWNGPERVLVDPSSRKNGVSHFAIDVAVPSPDGRYVAYVVAASGSEDGVIEILEVDSGRVLPDRIDRTQEPVISWRSDGRSFFYWRRAKPLPNAVPTDQNKNSATFLHTIGSNPDSALPVIGAGMRALGLGSHDYTVVEVTPGSRWALARVVPTAAKFSFFVVPLSLVKPGATRWRRVAAIEDGIVKMLVHDDRLYALTHAGAPNYRIVSLSAKGGSVAEAKDFVSESAFVLDDFVAARDAMYVVALDNGIHRLFSFSWATGERREIGLPFAGSIRRVVSDPLRSGLLFRMEGWSEPPRWLRFDPSVGAIHEVPIGPARGARSNIVAKQVMVTSRDSTEVPLSIVGLGGRPLNRTSPILLYAYGAYGTTLNPTYNPFTITWIRQGGIYAVCHVRGGGEKGEAWHSSGIRQQKENGVDDVIACAEYLIKEGYGQHSRLTAFGSSAGGIVIGGAITKRPDLFAAAVVRVGTLNVLRIEVTPWGPVHHAEYGDPKIKEDFQSLLASDPYHRVRDGGVYPAVLLTVGLNDPRVPAWIPAKFAARLQAANHERPTLLRVDMDAGHGVGSTQTQREEEYADIYAFALWQAGIQVK